MFKKIVIGLTISSLILVLVVIGIKVRKQLLPQTRQEVESLKKVSSKQLTLPQIEAKKRPGEDRSSQISQFQDSSQELLAYLEEFALPRQLQEEIQEAVGEGSQDREWAESPLTPEELKEVGLGVNQIAQSQLDKESQNIIAGHKVSQEAFGEMLKAALPEEVPESEQAKKLQAQALADLGFSAFEEFKFEEAEKAFEAAIAHYPNKESTSLVYLEYARLLAEQGRRQEARAVIAEAIDRYSDDKEFMSLAQDLEEAIENYE